MGRESPQCCGRPVPRTVLTLAFRRHTQPTPIAAKISTHTPRYPREISNNCVRRNHAMSEGKQQKHAYGVASSAPAADLGDAGDMIGTCADCQKQYKKDDEGTCDEVVYRIDWTHISSRAAFARIMQWCSAATTAGMGFV